MDPKEDVTPLRVLKNNPDNVKFKAVSHTPILLTDLRLFIYHNRLLSSTPQENKEQNGRDEDCRCEN